MTTLGEYIKVQGGYAYKSKDFIEFSNNKVLKIKNVRFGTINYAESAYVSDEIAASTKNWKVKEGDVLISMTGSGPNAPQSLVGRVARVWKNEPDAWINQRVGRVCLLDENSVHLDFIFYWLSLPQSQDYLVSNSSGSANQANISGKIIESLPCPKVDYQTSKQIADLARNFDEKVILNTQTNQTLEQMAQAIFKSWFVDFDPVKAKMNGEQPEGMDAATASLFPEKLVESELGLIPEGWEVKPLDKIAHFENGLALQKFRPESEDDEFLPVLKIAQLRQGYCDGKEKARTDIKESCRVYNGDMIFSWSGTLMIDLWTGGKAALNQHLFKVTSKDYTLPLYLYWTKHHLVKFQQIAKDKAVTMGHIKRGHLSESLCVVPPKDLRDKMDEILMPLINQGLNMRLQSNQLATLRDTLLPKLLSGEIELGTSEELVEAI